MIRAYLQMLQHAAAAGLHRRQDQTPYEFAPKLRHSLPDAEGDVVALTEGFVNVRYSPEPAGPDQAAAVVAHGERVQRALGQLSANSADSSSVEERDSKQC